MKKIIILLSFAISSITVCQTSSLLNNEFSSLPLNYIENNRGDKIIDFSYAGYKGGGVALPIFENVIDSEDIITLTPNGLDDTQQIKDAITQIGQKTPNNDGFRGGIKLSNGVFYINSRIDISKSGIIIKGVGGDLRNKKRTIIIDKRKTIDTSVKLESFYINGGGRPTLSNTNIPITDPYVPVGALSFSVSNTSNLSITDKIIVNINPQQKWIDDQQYNNAGSQWNNISFFQRNMKLERIVTNVNHSTKQITLNAPITSSIDKLNGYNIGSIQKITGDTRIENIGFEDLILASDYDFNKTDSNGFKNDEEHAAIGILFRSGKNGWAKNITGFFYRNSLIQSQSSVYSSNNWQVFWGLTIEDCAMLDGISKDNIYNHEGGRDYSFDISSSSSLVQRTYGRNGRHTFTTNSPANLVVFLDCIAENEHVSSGPHQKFSTGVLFDNVSTDGIFELNSVHKDSNGLSPHGQRTANSMLWNVTNVNSRTSMGDILLDKPLNNLGQQWLIGAKLTAQHPKPYWNVKNVITPSRKYGTANPQTYYGEPEAYVGDSAHFENIDSHVFPRSLYLRQLKDRLGEVAVNQVSDNLQSNSDPNIIGEQILNKLKDKYKDIPEFMSVDELINFYIEGFCEQSDDGFLDPETWINQAANYGHYQFEIGDFNGDSRDDVIAITKHDARFVVWESLETPIIPGEKFLWHHKWFQQDADYSNYQFEIGDFNGDGRDDVIAITKHNARFVVWESLETPINPGEKFLWHHKWFQQDTDYSNYQFEIGDFNGDGRDDVIAITKHNARFVVWESLETPINPGEKFLWHHKWFQQDADYSNYQFEIGDFNGDGRDDVIAITKHNARFVVWESLETPINPGEKFLWHHKWMQQDADYSNYQFEIGDFNGDGRDDVIAMNTSQEPKFHVWKSLETPSNGYRFSDVKEWYLGNTPYQGNTFKAGNFNEDCNDEIISIDKIIAKFDVWELGSNITTSISPPQVPFSKALSIEQNKLDKFKIYPNPVQGMLTILGNTIIDCLIVKDISGRVLKVIKERNSKFNIEVRDLAQGIYLLEVESNNKKQTLKFIKD